MMKMQFKKKLFIGAMFISFAYACIIFGLYFTVSNAKNIEATSDIMFNGILISIMLLFMIIIASISFINKVYAPISRLNYAMKMISDGDPDTRVGIKSGNEFQSISTSIDTMLNERVSALTNIEDENEDLNDSIVTLLGTVAELAQKNLNVKATVREDITGPLRLI